MADWRDDMRRKYRDCLWNLSKADRLQVELDMMLKLQSDVDAAMSDFVVKGGSELIRQLEFEIEQLAVQQAMIDAINAAEQD